jgi:hypothetical protein
MSRHPSVHPYDHPSISSWSVYTDRTKKEWNKNAVRQRIIYISVVNFFLLFFILGFSDLSTLILFLSQQLKKLGWVFFFFLILFNILFEFFNVFYTAIIFYYSSMDAKASSHETHFY